MAQNEPLRTNATVSATRNSQPVTASQHARVLLAAPTPENMSPEGVQVSTTMLAGRHTSWRTGDIVTIEAIDGFGDLDQVTRTNVLGAQRHGGLLPVFRVTLRGTLQ